MLKALAYLGLSLFILGCIQSDKSSEGLIIFENGPEQVSFSNFDLEQKEGLVTFRVGSFDAPYQLGKKCTDASCNQTRFDYKGTYMDFYFIADGDWTGNLENQSNDEIDLMLQTQVREIKAEIRFYENYENYENKNPLSFRVFTSWPDFVSGTSGHGITAFSRGSNNILIDLDFKEFEGEDGNGEVVSIDLNGSIILRLLL